MYNYDCQNNLTKTKLCFDLQFKDLLTIRLLLKLITFTKENIFTLIALN